MPAGPGAIRDGWHDGLVFFSYHGGVLGVLSSAMDIGHSSGPIVGGLLIAAYNYQTAFGIIGGIFLAQYRPAL